MLANAERSIGIDPPGEFDPEFVFLPHLTRIGVTRVVNGPSHPVAEHPQHRLPEPDPLGCVGLVGVEVVPLASQPYRQDVVGEPRGFTPDRRESRMALDERLVLEYFHPRETIRIGPHRVVNPREIDGQLSASLFEEMGKQEGHLVEGQRELLRPTQLIPLVRRGR